MAEARQTQSTTLPKKVSQAVPCQLRHFMKRFNMTDSTIKEVYIRFTSQVKRGLAKVTHPCADIKCFMSYVFNLPNGKEYGKFVVLNVDNTIRVVLVSLWGKAKPPEMVVKVYEIPAELVVTHGHSLFDYMASCLSDFVKNQGIEKETLPLGVTFAFPCYQTSLKTAKLVKWTKGFHNNDIVDQDIGKVLVEAIQRKGDLLLDLIVITNDTVGTLMSCAFHHKNCRIGVVLGNGINACYAEKTENCQLLDMATRKRHAHTIVNLEMGAFGENGDLDFLRTDYDKAIDSKTVNVGTQTFEKMTAALFLGEIMRLVLIKAIQNDLIFNDENKPNILHKLKIPNFIETKAVSKIERDKYPLYKYTEATIKTLFDITSPKVEDCYKLLYIASCISRRSATLIGIGLASIVNKIAQPKITIGLDGILYRKHPKYECYICKAMKKLVDKRYRYRLVPSEDAAGLGTAIITAANLPGRKETNSVCPK